MYYVTVHFATSVLLQLCFQNVIIEGKLYKVGINFEQLTFHGTGGASVANVIE